MSNILLEWVRYLVHARLGAGRWMQRRKPPLAGRRDRRREAQVRAPGSRREVKAGLVPRSERKEREDREFLGRMRRSKFLRTNPEDTGSPKSLRNSTGSVWASPQARTWACLPTGFIHCLTTPRTRMRMLKLLAYSSKFNKTLLHSWLVGLGV